MKVRISTRPVALLSLGFVLSGTVGAQQVDATAARMQMYESASAIYDAITSARGPLEGMLGINRAEEMIFELDDGQRMNWQFWPTVRVGLAVEYMSAEQKRLTHDLLRAAMSSDGYLKVVQIMQLEQILDMLDEAGFPRAVDHYKLVLFGTPSMTDDWAWRFEGHHVSLNVVVSAAGVRVTPSFFGSNPAEVLSGPLAGFRVHGIVEDLARDLVNSLDDRDREIAVASDRAPRDIFTANIGKEPSEWEAWRETLRPEGVRVADLNEVQRHWVGRILDEAIGNYRPEIAMPYRADIDIDALRFVWMGSTERGEPHYFRLQGGDFVFEYDNVQNGGNHVHSVWRDKSADFGEDVLGDHYRTSHVR